MKKTRKAIALIFAGLMLAAALAGCQAKAPEAPVLQGVYNAVAEADTWNLFGAGGNQYTDVRAAQLFLYSDGTYLYQDTFHEFDKLPDQTDEVDLGMPAMHISITTMGTYTSEEDAETDGKLIIHLSGATRLIYSGSDPFFADSQGFYDSADESTKELFGTNTLYGSNPDQLLADFGAERDVEVNQLTGQIDTPLGTALYNEGHSTFEMGA